MLDYVIKRKFTVKQNFPGSQKSADCPYQAIKRSF